MCTLGKVSLGLWLYRMSILLFHWRISIHQWTASRTVSQVSLTLTMSQQNDIGTFSMRLYMEANKVVGLLEMPQVESDPFFN